ncbi:DUF2157 domain-containing protein [Chitinophaga lutea]
MRLQIFERLAKEGLISDATLERARNAYPERTRSLHWELRILLYAGVLLLSGGLGVLIYQNIDTIGHQAVLALIALGCAGCFYYAVKRQPPFSRGKTAARDAWQDYIVLLGCLLFLTFITYLQAQYNVFGTRYGSLTFIPMVFLFACAYYFDHAGVLSMAITNFAAWLGLTITPLNLLTGNDFSSLRLICTGLGLGAILLLAGYASQRFDVKAHFRFTYDNFGVHVLIVSCIAGQFTQYRSGFWFLGVIGLCYGLYRKAMAERSFYFLLFAILYAYVSLSRQVIYAFEGSRGGETVIYLILFYFIFSAIAVVMLLIHLNKNMKSNERV